MERNYTPKKISVLLVLLIFLCFQLKAVKPNPTSGNFPKEVSVKKEAKRNIKGLSLKQKASLFLLKKIAVKKAKQEAKNQNPKLSKKLAVASFVIGIVAVLLLPASFIVGALISYQFIFPGLILMGILSILTVVFASKSLKRIKRNPEKYGGKGMAITGLVLGLALLLFWLSVGIAWLGYLGLFRTLFA